MENKLEHKTNSDAVFSIILGVSSLVIPVLGVIIAIIGIIFSVKSLRTIKETNEPGIGLGITGLICSILTIVLHILTVVIFLVFFLFIMTDVSGGYYY